MLNPCLADRAVKVVLCICFLLEEVKVEQFLKENLHA